MSYFAQLLSTSLLVATGRAEGSWPVAVACVLIAGGAALASADTLRSARRRRRAGARRP
ncbi:hypothetical protein [Streptomyces violascens]|uniref:hypothetical protein n=1 Tax=Streptomyces violascens TaxID=67381 RepID=UPI00367C4824